jgi:hypothetical protein
VAAFPRARRARFLLCAPALPLTACAVLRRQARGALGASLNDREEILTAST